MENKEWLNYQQLNVEDVDTNGFRESKTQDGALNATAPIGIKKEKPYMKGLRAGWEAKKRLKRYLTKPCLVCGKLVHYQPCTKDRVKYCSKACKHIAQKGVYNGSRDKYRIEMAELVKKPPQPGEVRTAMGAGLPTNDRATRQWQECPQCHIQRWVRVRRERPLTTQLCRRCFNANQQENICEKNRHWKGGRSLNPKGYYTIRLSPDDPYYSMINRTGTVMEHRLVMAKHLGRCLHGWEVVHHKNHIKTDNRLNNLELYSIEKHEQLTILENHIKDLERKLYEKEHNGN